MGVEIIRGTDKNFALTITNKSTKKPFDFTGFAGANLALVVPGESADLTISLTPNANGTKLLVPEPKIGRIEVTISDIDTLLMKVGSGQAMELTIKSGAGPDYDIKKVQFASSLDVKKGLFET